MLAKNFNTSHSSQSKCKSLYDGASDVFFIKAYTQITHFESSKALFNNLI